MKKILAFSFMLLFVIGCNNEASETKTSDSTAVIDKTINTDTSLLDTGINRDTLQ